MPSRSTYGPSTSVTNPRLSDLSSSQRQEVLGAVNRLREMPPFAREREIDSGRYSNFSPEERELLKQLAK
jgi:hypothetical protein